MVVACVRVAAERTKQVAHVGYAGSVSESNMGKILDQYGRQYTFDAVPHAACAHLNVRFDAGVSAAMELPAAEVRKRWPRFEGACSCGYYGIAYESWTHYLAGDW